MLEASERFHAAIQRILTRMAKRRVAQIVGEADRLDKLLVETEHDGNGPADLRDFEGMRQAGAVVIAFVIDEDLGLVYEPAKGGRVNDAIAVTLKFAAIRVRGLGMNPAPAAAVRRRVALQTARHTEKILAQ